jgi:hypothetical protein
VGACVRLSCGYRIKVGFGTGVGISIDINCFACMHDLIFPFLSVVKNATKITICHKFANFPGSTVRYSFCRLNLNRQVKNLVFNFNGGSYDSDLRFCSK